MRNRSKRFHLPSQEWSKIIRFNSQDYLLRSVYDKDADMQRDPELNKEIDIDKALKMTGTTLDELPWNRPIPRRRHRINEDFMDDMGEFGFGDGDYDEGDIASRVKDEVDAELAAEMSYVFLASNGSEVNVKMSPDNFRNVIMFLMNPIVRISATDTRSDVDAKIDDYVYASGRLNGMYAYRINVIDVKSDAGIPRFIISRFDNSNRRGGYINVHFTEERDAVISISFPGVAYKRPFRLVKMEYAEFCEFLPQDRITGRKKPLVPYYNGLLQQFVMKLLEAGAQLTLMQRTGNIDKRLLSSMVDNMNVIRNNFKPVMKFSQKSPGDMNMLKTAVESDSELIDFMFNSNPEHMAEEDDWFVMLGGSETFYERLEDSVWGGRFGCALPDGGFMHVRFYKQHPEISTKRIENNAIIIPLSRLVNIIPCLWLWMMC